MVSARELNVEGARCRGNVTRGVRNVVRLEAFLVSPVNFLGKNGVLFIRHLIDSYGVNLRLPRVWKLFFVPVCTRFFASCLSHVFPLRFSTRESRVWDNEGNEELSGNSGETEATVAKHMTRRTFVAAACGAVAAAACGPVTVTMLGCAKQNADDSAWTWEEDADLPVLCMEVSGGAIVAMPGNGWKPQDEWIQLQLSGGSIPGKEIEAITQEGSTLVVRLKKPKSDMETMDLCLTEYRVAGGDVSSVELVVVEDKGERLEAQLGVDGEARAVQ